MSLVKYNSDRSFPGFRSILDDFFGPELGIVRNNNFSSTNTTIPAVNIREEDDGFIVEMAAPGMAKEDFAVNLDNNILNISSEKKAEKSIDESKYNRMEFSYQSFKRSFTLPDTVDNDKIEAKYENGVLMISIPKKEEAKPQPPKQIQIL